MKKLIMSAAVVGSLVGLTACGADLSKGDQRDITATATTTTFVTDKLAPAHQTNDTPAPEDDSYGDAPSQLTYLLDEWGVYYASEEAAVGMAEFICGELNSGETREYVLTLLLIGNTAEQQYSDDEIASIMAASIIAYCPWQAP